LEIFFRELEPQFNRLGFRIFWVNIYLVQFGKEESFYGGGLLEDLLLELDFPNLDDFQGWDSWDFFLRIFEKNYFFWNPKFLLGPLFQFGVGNLFFGGFSGLYYLEGFVLLKICSPDYFRFDNCGWGNNP